MKVLVKTKKADIKMEGNIPNEILSAVNKAFKKSVKILNDEGEEIILATESDWFKDINNNTLPGTVIQIYRENMNLSQADLGKIIGKSNHYISDLENGRRNITITVAKQLSDLFDISIGRLIK